MTMTMKNMMGADEQKQEVVVQGAFSGGSLNVLTL